jgi:hypothetical protein
MTRFCLTFKASKDLLSLQPHVLFEKAVRYGKRKLLNKIQRRRDIKYSTYARSFSTKVACCNYREPCPASILLPHAEEIRCLAAHYLAHRFDLLGSGWTQVRHNMRCRGVAGYLYDSGPPINVDRNGLWLAGRINESNLGEATGIWRMLDDNYIPIDWQLDFKSGYRWSESTWYKDIPYGHRLGVDIKVPWELSRMQHLPQLAWAYALARHGAEGFEPAEVYCREFRNQVLDFIASNPPRYGVNWRCSMDVGIRVANWLLVYDLFRAFEVSFDQEFNEIFSRAVYEHGWHIINNLEWVQEFRGNHYLCNITGLLFVAAYLPRTPEADAWLAFAMQELIKEVEYQFWPDGSHFEASTSYHRLTSEAVAYATALVLGLPVEKQQALKEYDHRLHKVTPALAPGPLKLDQGAASQGFMPFPPWYLERLEKMAEFTIHITKPNGYIHQVGDNDSGRFFKLQAALRVMKVGEAKARYVNLAGYNDLPDEAIYWDEAFLDHRHLVAAINGFFRKDEFLGFTGDDLLDSYITRCLAKEIRLPSYRAPGVTTAAEGRTGGEEEALRHFLTTFNASPAQSKIIMEIKVPEAGLLQGLQRYAYPDFGLYIFSSPRFYLALRCGSLSREGQGAHAHNDQLAIELNVAGEDWLVDPGTFLYTPLPECRNEYRSVKAHFAPQLANGREPGDLRGGLFQLEDRCRAEMRYFNADTFLGRHLGYGEPVWCCLKVDQNQITIYRLLDGDGLALPHGYSFAESTEGSHTYLENNLSPGRWSPGYGKEAVYEPASRRT